jgi:hypothetical protein
MQAPFQAQAGSWSVVIVGRLMTADNWELSGFHPMQTTVRGAPLSRPYIASL